MNRCEDSGLRYSRGAARERDREKERRKRRKRRTRGKRTVRSALARAKGGPCGEDKTVKKKEEKVLTGRRRNHEEEEASIAGFVVGLLVICSFDIIASELFRGA